MFLRLKFIHISQFNGCFIKNGWCSCLKKVKAVIFDMDGLMIDTERLYFEVERIMARKFGKEVRMKPCGR